MARRRAWALPAVFVALAACTGGGSPSTPSPASCVSGDPSCQVLTVQANGAAYQVECSPVPRALVDVMLTGQGGRPIRAITGVSSMQAVAVLVRDPAGCGEFALALAEGLSGTTAELIRDEMARAVERFGVTLSPTPTPSATGY